MAEIRIDGDAKPFVDAVKEVPRAAKDAAKQVSTAFGDAGAKSAAAMEAIGPAAVQAGTAIVASAVGAAAAYKALADEIYGTVDSLNTLAQGSGLSIETVNGLRLAAASANKELSELFPKELQDRLKGVETGSRRAVAAFEALGVNTHTLAGDMRPLDDVYRDILRKLFEIEDPTERAARAFAVMGESGKQALSAFSSVDDLDRFVGLGSEFGLRVGPDAVAASNAWWGATSNLNLAIETAKQDLLDLADSVVPVTQLVNEFALGFVFLERVALGSLSAIGDQFSDIYRLVTGQISVADYWAASMARGSEVWQGAAEDAFSFWQSAEGAVESTTGEVEGLNRELGRVGPLSLGAAGAVAAAAADAKVALAQARAEAEALANVLAHSAESEAEDTRRANELLTENQAARREYDAAVAEGARLRAEAADAAETAEEAAHSATVDRIKDIYAITKTVADAVVQVWITTAERRADAAAQAATEAIREEERLQAELDRLTEERAATDDLARQAELDGQMATTNAKLEDAKEFAEVQKEEALEQFRRSQKVQYAAALINALAAASLAFATIPWPASIVAAAAAAAQAGATAIAIKAQPEPEFPGGTAGFSPDHFGVGVQRGEAILPRRAVGLVGEDAVRRQVRGEAPPAGDVHVWIGRRELRAAGRALQAPVRGARYGKAGR